MKILVTGAKGQLGHHVMIELAKRGYNGIGCDIFLPQSESYLYLLLDITDAYATENAILEMKPDVVIHCAAWTDVDFAECKENISKVNEINVGGTKNIAIACKKIGCKMIYISTDYVFDGRGTEPWLPDCKDCAPRNAYGQSKLDGETIVANTLAKYYIVRTAWLFGFHGRNFIKNILNLGQRYSEIRVVNDQISTPTYASDLSRLLVDMAEVEKYGYYHATNEGGYISWYDFAVEICKQSGISTKVIPVTTTEYGISKADRPYNSRLNKLKLIENVFRPLPIWQDALSRYLKEIL